MKIILDVPDAGSAVELLTLWEQTHYVYARRPAPRRAGEKGGVADRVYIKSLLIETTPDEDAVLPARLDSIKRSQPFREQQD